MTKAQHTPAPWRVTPRHDLSNQYHIWDEHCNYHNEDEMTPEKMDANSRLIAAAPSMYDELKKLNLGLLLPQDSVRIATLLAQIEGA